MTMDRDRERCFLLMYLIYEKKWLVIKPISEVDRSPCCGEIFKNLFVIDFDELKNVRKVKMQANGDSEYLKQIATCDALVIDENGKIFFIEFKSLKKLIENAGSQENFEHSISKLNFKNKFLESFFGLYELISKLDKGSFRCYLEKIIKNKQRNHLEVSEELAKLFNFNEVHFLVAHEDDGNLLNSELWANFSLKAIFNDLEFRLNELRNNFPINCYIERIKCEDLIKRINFCLINKVLNKRCI